ncbi:MAG: hypothetical protein ACFFER_20345 [Candidatus Thorarchaeota archaeon]
MSKCFGSDAVGRTELAGLLVLLFVFSHIAIHVTGTTLYSESSVIVQESQSIFRAANLSAGQGIAGWLEIVSGDGVDFFIVDSIGHNETQTSGFPTVVYKEADFPSSESNEWYYWNFTAPHSDTWYVYFSNTVSISHSNEDELQILINSETEPPVISLRSISGGAPGVFIISFVATDDCFPIERVDLYVEGVLHNTVYNDNNYDGVSFESAIEFNSTGYDSGMHTLVLRAYDSFGKESIPLSLEIEVPPQNGGLLGVLSDPFVQLIVAAAMAAVAGLGYSRSRRKPRFAIDSSIILQAIGALEGVRYCILSNIEKRSHILAKSYLATAQDSFIIRALENIAVEGLKGKDLPGFTFEMSLHGQKVFVYGGKRIAGVLTAGAEDRFQYKQNLQLLVDTFEEEFEMEILDWPKNISIYGDIWRIIGPDATDAERIKTFVFSLEEGAIRAEIANRLNMSVKKVSDIVKQILDTDPDFLNVRSGQKEVVLYRSVLLDEETHRDTS